MNIDKAQEFAQHELLLLLFAAGALIGVLYREFLSGLFLSAPDWTLYCNILILAGDAAMLGSLLAWYTIPLTTLIFGAVSAVEADEILTAGLWKSSRQSLLIALIVPLHFLLGAWGMRTAGRLHGLLRGRAQGKRLRRTSFLLAIGTSFLCIALIWLKLHALL